MLIRNEKPITKEQYERAQLNNGLILDEDIGEIFTISEFCAYGVYSPIVYKRYNEATGETTYTVSYITSTNCD